MSLNPFPSQARSPLTFHDMSFINGFLELGHLDGYYGTLVAFVAQTSTSTIHSLLHIFRGEQSVDYGDVASSIQTGYTCGDTLTDIVEVGRLATNDRAEDDDSIVAVVERHLVSTIDEFEGAGNSLHMDVLRQRTMTLQGRNAAVEQRPSNFGVPLGIPNIMLEASGTFSTLYSERFLVAIAYLADARSMYLSMVWYCIELKYFSLTS